jgi:hypothetical protein
MFQKLPGYASVVTFEATRGPWNGQPSVLLERPNAQVNRQKCEAFLSVLNLQLGIAR